MWRITSFVLLAFSILLLSASAQAEDPGELSLTAILSSPHSIRNIGRSFGGSERLCEVDPELGEVCMDFRTSFRPIVDSKGRISGSAAVHLSVRIDGDRVLSASVYDSVRGRIKGKYGTARLKVKFRGRGHTTGWGPFYGQSLPLSTNYVAKGVIEPSELFSAVADGKLCIRTMGCTRFLTTSEPTSLGSGTWRLYLDPVMEPARNGNGTLTGSARAVAGGETIYYTIDGQYDARRDESFLRLLPRNGPRGSKIDIWGLRIHDYDGYLYASADAVDYRLMGYKGVAEDESFEVDEPYGGYGGYGASGSFFSSNYGSVMTSSSPYLTGGNTGWNEIYPFGTSSGVTLFAPGYGGSANTSLILLNSNEAGSPSQ